MNRSVFGGLAVPIGETDDLAETHPASRPQSARYEGPLVPTGGVVDARTPPELTRRDYQHISFVVVEIFDEPG